MAYILLQNRHFLKQFRLFLCVFALLLQSCQHNDSDDELGTRKHNLQEAAGYNVQLGLGYLKQGNISRAKRKLLIALKQDPKSANVNAAMGYYMEKTGEIDKAGSYYQKAMALAPGRGTQLNNYGAFLCRQGKYTQSEAYFMKAVKDVEYEHTAGAYENAGLCALSIPDEKKAERYFRHALAQDPSKKQSLYQLIKIEMALKRYNDALNDLKKYPEIVLQTRELLALGKKAAHFMGNASMEADYKVTTLPVPTSRGLSAGSSDVAGSLNSADKPRNVGSVDRPEQLH